MRAKAPRNRRPRKKTSGQRAKHAAKRSASRTPPKILFVRPKIGSAYPRKISSTPGSVVIGTFSNRKVSKGGIILPDSADGSLVAPSKLRQGLKSAKLEIQSMLDDFVSMMGERYRVAEIELSAGFSADGKFLGFGVGGAATIKVKIRPAAK